jgi:hypothetical protein
MLGKAELGKDSITPRHEGSPRKTPDETDMIGLLEAATTDHSS